MTLNREEAILELSHSLADISDYKDLWQAYQFTITKFFHIDWLGIFTTPRNGEVFNITSNPHLPFNWDELYQKVAPYDVFCKTLVNMPIGKALIYEEIHDPSNEITRSCLDYVAHHTNTVHMMGMTTNRDEDGLSVLGLYRSDKPYGFTSDEKHLFMHLSPLLHYASKQMLLHQQWDLQRVAYDKLFESDKILPILMDCRLKVIDFPLATLTFLRRMFDDPRLEYLPPPINDWIMRYIAPSGKINPNTGPWRRHIKAPSGFILCQAYILTTEKKQSVLLLRFDPHHNTEDFSVLASLGLTKREIEVLSYLPLGYTNKQIAMAMSIGEDGVKKHFKRLSKKLNASGRTELLYQALQIKREIKRFGEALVI